MHSHLQFLLFFLLGEVERKKENASKYSKQQVNIFHLLLAKPRADSRPLQTTSICLHPRQKGKRAKHGGLMIGVWVSNQDSNQLSVLGFCPPSCQEMEGYERNLHESSQWLFLPGQGAMIITVAIIRATTVVPMIY